MTKYHVCTTAWNFDLTPLYQFFFLFVKWYKLLLNVRSLKIQYFDIYFINVTILWFICRLKDILQETRNYNSCLQGTFCHVAWINNWLQRIEITSIHIEWEKSVLIGSISFSRFGEFTYVYIAYSKNQIHLFIKKCIRVVFELDINHYILRRTQENTISIRSWILVKVTGSFLNCYKQVV